ncbi:nucleoside triphosphate pyrophosphohydrolase [Streptomyces sp. NPDC057697]|uniref:nucleoside triphosphate pyrophosphohydrolase n=1 Tax=Streptomyces sp. NPDC057697 TaxID=3346219 RepID=UPI0036CF97B5
MGAMLKLVRDGIPEIIRRNGEEPATCVAGAPEYRKRLRDKLSEEVGEFLEVEEDYSKEELADVLEVVYALAQDLGITLEDLERCRAEKAAERGGFEKRIIWTGMENGSGRP